MLTYYVKMINDINKKQTKKYIIIINNIFIAAASGSSLSLPIEENVVVEKAVVKKAIKKAVKEVEPEFLYDDGKY